MTNSIYVDPVTWDLVVDASGNIAVATQPYSLAQDAACAIQLFLGELYYDTTQGVPYWDKILGQFPPLALVKAQMVEAAMTVMGVVAAQCFISSFENREVHGQVQITDREGNRAFANI